MMVTYTRIDDCLSTRNGHLFIEECDTVDLIQQFGSPLFVLSENQIRRNVRRFQEAFQRGWPDGPVKVLPAAKANWISAVQRILADEGCGCDIYSPGELTVLVTGDQASIIRRRETEADVFRRDVMPEHLIREKVATMVERIPA